MITFFTLPEAFEGQRRIVQCNAVRSWQRVADGCQVIVIGDGPGLAEAVAELGVEWLPDVERTPQGTPLVSSAFALAERAARHDLLCYASAELIFFPDLADALELVRRAKRRFLAVGEAWEVDVAGAPPIGAADWTRELRAHAEGEGHLRGRSQIDFFAFPRDTLGPLPPFAAGRPWWSNWLVWHGRSLRLPVVDISAATMVVHQRHGPRRGSPGRGGPHWEAEAAMNAELTRGAQYYTLREATHVTHGQRVLPRRGSLGYRLKRAVTTPPARTGIRRAVAPHARPRRLTEIDPGAVGTWDSDAVVATIEVAPSVEVDRTAARAEPAVQPGVDDSTEDEEPAYVAPAAQLTRIRGGLVETSASVAFTAEGGFLGSSIKISGRNLEARGYRLESDERIVLPSRPRRAVDQPALLLALPHDNDNYFHALIESLGQLLLTRHLLPADVLLLARPGASAEFIPQLLVEAIAGADSLFELPKDHVVAFPELYVPPVTVLSSARTFPRGRHLDFRLHPAAVHAVRTLAPPRSGGGLRLYVTRRRRKPVNDADVAAVAAAHGLVEVDAERLSIREQMELFANAELVLGAHGAGLANIVFSTGATVVELQSSELQGGARNLYWSLAAICGLRWVRVVCRPAGPPSAESFHVDCDHLARVLRHHLPRRVPPVAAP